MSNRVWIYASLKKLDETTEHSIRIDIGSFLSNWKAHDVPLSATFEILFHHIIVLKADEDRAVASGCSIDKQVHFMKELGNKYNLDFFNRTLVAFQKDQEFFIYPSSKTKLLLENGILNENSLVFNLAVSTDAEFDSEFQTPLINTWLSKYLSLSNP